VDEPEELRIQKRFAVLYNDHEVLNQRRKTHRISGVNVSLPLIATSLTELSLSVCKVNHISGKVGRVEEVTASIMFALKE
jgi:hypothetical protein